MSAPGHPVNDGQVKSQFLAGRAAASSGIDPEVLALAEGGGGAQAAPQAKPSPGAPPSSAALPLGLQISQSLRAAGAAKAAQMDAQIAAAGKGGMGDAFKAAISGAWDTLRQDFAASHASIASPEAVAAFQKHSFWDQAKAMFHEDMAAGKLPLDAFNLALSPLSGAVSAATKGVDEGVHKLLPFVPSGAVKSSLDQAMLGLGPEGGELGEASLAAKASKPAPKAAAPDAAAPKAAAEPAAEPAPAAAAEASEPPPRVFDIEGQSPGAKLKITPQVRKQAVEYLAGKRADNPIQVSLENLSRDPDISKTVEDVARFIPKGSVKPDDIRDMNAYSLNLEPDELMSGLVPAIPSDEAQGAAGLLVNSAASQFQKYAQAAVETPTPANHELAVRAWAQLNEYIGKFRDAGTDLGRGLRARQAATDTADHYTKAVKQIIEDLGPENTDEAIRKAAALPDPKTVSPFVSSMRWQGGRDGLLYGWYNWLLSNPATVVKKLTSDATVMGWNTAVRYAAEKFGSGDVRPGEAAQLVAGYAGSMRDAIAAAGKALKAGRSQFYGDYQTMDGRVIEATANHPASLGLPENVTTAAQEFARSILPTSWIGAADDFAKVVNYRAEARALAYRDGMAKNLSGEDLSNHVAQTVNNVPPHIHHQAVSAALRNTFQEPLTGIAASMQEIVDRINIPVPGTGLEIPLGRAIMPFVKVPANIARFAYRNGPLAALLPSSTVKAELMAGGATADLAKARMGLGTAVSMILAPFMLGGQITGRGPTDPQLNRAWQSAGNKPYSVHLGGKWYGYNKVEPLGMTLAAMADTIDTVKFAHDEDAEQLAWSAAFGVGDAMLSKTYLQNMSDFLDALHDPQGEGKYFGDKLTASMAMPQGAAALAAASDPWLRQHYGLLDAIQARTPGLAAELPPVRDLWGQPVPKDKGYSPVPLTSGTTGANLLSPVSMAPADNAQPIDKWIWENRAAFPAAEQGRLGLTRPGQVQSYESASGRLSVPLQLNPLQVDRLRALAGNELKDPRTGMGARDALNALVAGKSSDASAQRQWNGASPAARAAMVLRIFNAYRDAAKKQVLAENPDMQAALAEKMNTRVEALKAPSLGGN